MVTVTRVQIEDYTVCSSHRANTLREGMYSTIRRLAIGKQNDRLGSLTLVCKPI